MRARRAAILPINALAILLAGCAAPSPQDPGSDPTQPTPRTSWILRHRVVETHHLRVVGSSMNDFEESTTVTLGGHASNPAVHCYVSLSVPGWGGPENKVGEKVPTRVHGRPGFRNGAGAEGDYLMWQLEDGGWVETGCDGPDERTEMDAVAAAVEMAPATVGLPFGVGLLPTGYSVSSVVQDLEQGLTRVAVAPAGPAARAASGELEITSATRGSDDGHPTQPPTGRRIILNGRPAVLQETPHSPGVCVFVQQHQVCVSTLSSDTGPYPDRSDEVPTILSIAESLTFADDLDDRSTWIPAERALR